MRTAAFDCIKVLSGQGIIFFNLASSEFHHFPGAFATNFILKDGVERLIKGLSDLEKDVQTAALNCIKALSGLGIIFFNCTSQALTIPQMTFESRQTTLRN